VTTHPIVVDIMAPFATAATESTRSRGKAEVGYLYKACHRAFIGTYIKGRKKTSKGRGRECADGDRAVMIMESTF
jgi:hypothetical protein